jgi:hypothetical protein
MTSSMGVGGSPPTGSNPYVLNSYEEKPADAPTATELPSMYALATDTAAGEQAPDATSNAHTAEPASDTPAKAATATASYFQVSAYDQ